MSAISSHTDSANRKPSPARYAAGRCEKNQGEDARELATPLREQRHAQLPFSCRDVEVLGTTLLHVDVTLENILTARLKTDGVPRPISDPHVEELQGHKSLLDTALHENTLNNEGRTYFTRLQTIEGEFIHGRDRDT